LNVFAIFATMTKLCGKLAICAADNKNTTILEATGEWLAIN